MSGRSGFEAAGGVAYAILGDDVGGAIAEAVRLLGGRVAGTWPLDDTDAAIAAGAAVIAVDVRAAAGDAAFDALARLEAAAGSVVVALREDQIDAVAAAALGLGAELLCAPDTLDWIAALAAAPLGGGRVREGGDAEARVARLEAEVGRLAALLAAIETRPSDDRAADRRTDFAAPVNGEDPPAAAIRAVIRARRLRERFFPAGHIEDPAWDMLLDLFAAYLEEVRVSVSSLCIAASVPPTTALRWIGRLTAAGLLERHPDPADRRRAFMTLSQSALAGMRGYVAAAREAALPLV
jgi:hypothetical protein